VYTLPPADISAEALYFLYTEPEFSNLCDVQYSGRYCYSSPPHVNEASAPWVQTQFKRTIPRPKFVGGLKSRLKTRAQFGIIFSPWLYGLLGREEAAISILPIC
jgi:hypothetical protein